MKRFVIFLTGLVFPLLAFSQGVTRHTYHDPEKRHLKEVFQVRDTLSNILEGKYASYYLNGNMESKGQFLDNETSGVWFFYYETGELKMKGTLLQSTSFGAWEYYYKNGNKSMEGFINGKSREGIWKIYYESGQLKEVGEYIGNKRLGNWKTFYDDGKLKGQTTYRDDRGEHVEYYPSGRILAKGMMNGNKQSGKWRYYTEEGTVESEGHYEKGKKTGEWTYFHNNGAVAAQGDFAKGKADGSWKYFYRDGVLKSTGAFSEGTKNGYWRTVSADGTIDSEITYENGVGQYRAYYPDGQLKVRGMIKGDDREGTWDFFTKGQSLEGTCEYHQGRGTYRGYFPEGALQTKGEMHNERKVGTWEIYKKDGSLAGYYRPLYDDKKPEEEVTTDSSRSTIKKVIRRGTRFTYFDTRFNEFRGVIVGSNPLFAAVGEVPFGVEFYMQGRLGHEFEFIGIRDPFFVADHNIDFGQRFRRGHSVSIKQKFYNPFKAGMWYFGHELRFTNTGHFINIKLPFFPDGIFTPSAVEQKITYGLLLGYRIMKRSDAGGFTIDLNASYHIGYRGFDVEDKFQNYFGDIDQSRLAHGFRFGLNFGNIFSYR